MTKDPTYGTSTHYSGSAGIEYFNWQDIAGPINGEITARTFLPYITQSDILLDFGCGGGHLLNSLPAIKKIGVEINPIARESARKFCDETYASIEEVPTNSVDVAISNHALEHVPYPVRALTEINRVLKPGGKLVLCVPIDDWRTQRRFDLQDINHHLNTWTPQLLGNSLTESGFSAKSIRIDILVHAWFPSYIKHWKRQFYFDFLCRIYSWKVKRRQLLAVVTK